MKKSDKAAWTAFVESGQLFFANTLLHFAGWAIVVWKDDGEIVQVRPERVPYRGFSEVTDGFKKFHDYLAANIADIKKETDDRGDDT